jgi:SAM-dependent methyltransferase
LVLYIIHKVPLFRRLYFHVIGRPFVGKKIRPLAHLLPKNTPILDIGSGNGLAAHLLRVQGFDIVPMDIHEGQYHHSVKPIVYDGSKIPFPDDHFECGIILTVLHHVDDPDALLQEIMRVCKRLVIMEDIYRTDFQKRLTFWLDTAANLFYSPCPHTNKDDQGWRDTFDKMDLTLEHAEYRRVLFVVRQGIYTVSKKQHAV